MAASRRTQLLLVLAAGAAVMAFVFWGNRAASDVGAKVVSESPAGTGWKTIEFDGVPESQGVRVDIPAHWQRSDTDGCEFRFEHWAPPGSPACEADTGVSFYVSATYDPAQGPGVRHAEPNRTDPSHWAGYVYAGDFAVYAADDDRDLVVRLLDSARATPN